MAGTNYAGSTLPSAWASFSSTARATGQVNVFDSTSNDFYLTGVQLEVGSVATDFEHRSFGQELALCQRYYAQNNKSLYLMAYGSNAINNVYFPVTMRAAPSVTEYTVSGNLTSISNIGTDSFYMYKASSDGAAGTGYKASAEL